MIKNKNTKKYKQLTNKTTTLNMTFLGQFLKIFVSHMTFMQLVCNVFHCLKKPVGDQITKTNSFC